MRCNASGPPSPWGDDGPSRRADASTPSSLVVVVRVDRRAVGTDRLLLARARSEAAGDRSTEDVSQHRLPDAVLDRTADDEHEEGEEQRRERERPLAGAAHD